MLKLDQVTKRFRGGVTAVSEVSLELGAGVVGLLGPNGAGKTTLMQLIATITRPTSGQIHFQGTDILREPETLRRHLGYLPQDFGVYDNLTAFEFLAYLHSDPDGSNVVGMNEADDAPCRQCSGSPCESSQGGFGRQPRIPP